jgi:hypothetical protein
MRTTAITDLAADRTNLECTFPIKGPGVTAEFKTLQEMVKHARANLPRGDWDFLVALPKPKLHSSATGLPSSGSR